MNRANLLSHIKMTIFCSYVLSLTVVSTSYAIRGDIDRDGDVDLTDFFLFADNFGKTGSADASDCSSTVTSDDSEPIVIDTDLASAFVSGGDITNALASSRSGDCATYVNTYFSSVIDLVSGNSFSGDVTISVSGDKCVFNTNAISNHDMGEDGAFATPISEQSLTYEVTTSPVKAATPTTNIWKASVFLLNGGTVDILPAACYDVGDDNLGREMIGCGPDLIDHPWRYDAMSSLNSFGTDIHNAHVQPDGMYHYHATPNAIFESDCSSVSSGSPVIGFAADGFPVFGSCISNNGSIRNAQSSYQLKDGGGPRQTVSGYVTPTGGTGSIASSNYDGQFRGDWEYVAGSGDLDECNGMTVDGQYGYYITDSFPWVLACYSGTPDASFNPTPTGPPPQ